MKRTFALAAAATIASSAMAGSASAATLIGTPVTASLTGYGHVTVTSQFTSPVLVTDGAEFTGSILDNGFNQPFDVLADFSDSVLTVSITSMKPNANVFGYDLLRLDFGSTEGLFSPVGEFTRTGCSSFLCGFSSLSSSSADSNSISLSLSGLAAGDVFELQLAPTSAVPEPATWAMMIVGFGAVGAAMRRRQKLATGALSAA